MHQHQEPISDDEDLLPIPDSRMQRAYNDIQAQSAALTDTLPLNQAKHTIQKAIDANPGDPKGYLWIGAALSRKSNDHLAAIEQLSAFLKLVQKRPAVDFTETAFLAYTCRATARASTGDYAGALQDATEALKVGETPDQKSTAQEIRRQVVEVQIKLKKAQQQQQQQPATTVHRYGSATIQEIIDEPEDPAIEAASTVQRAIEAGERLAASAVKKGQELETKHEEHVKAVEAENILRQERNAKRKLRRQEAAAASKNKSSGGKDTTEAVVLERTRIPIVEIDTPKQAASTAADHVGGDKKKKADEVAVLVEKAIKQRRWEDALEHCTKHLDKNKTDSYVLFLEAKAEYELQQYKSCAASCEKALAFLSSSATQNGSVGGYRASSPAASEYDIRMLNARALKHLGELEHVVSELEAAQVVAITPEQDKKAASEVAQAIRSLEQQQRQKVADSSASKGSVQTKLKQQQPGKNKKMVEEIFSSSVSEDDKQHAVGNSKEQGASMEDEFDVQGADEERERGNKLFKERKYEAALDAYESSTVLNPSDPRAYANAAAVLLKLERWEDVIQQCEVALELDPKYAKAYRRRAEAYKNEGHLAAAVIDLRMVLKLEPKEVAVKKELKKLEEEMKKKGVPVPHVEE